MKLYNECGIGIALGAFTGNLVLQLLTNADPMKGLINGVGIGSIAAILVIVVYTVTYALLPKKKEVHQTLNIEVGFDNEPTVKGISEDDQAVLNKLNEAGTVMTPEEVKAAAEKMGWEVKFFQDPNCKVPPEMIWGHR